MLLVWADSCEVIQQRCSDVVFSLSESFLFLFLLVFSSGWSTLSSFSIRPFAQSFCYITLVLGSFYFIFYFLARTALFILQAFFLPLVFSFLTKNTAYLHFRVAWVESMEDQVNENEVEVCSPFKSPFSLNSKSPHLFSSFLLFFFSSFLLFFFSSSLLFFSSFLLFFFSFFLLLFSSSPLFFSSSLLLLFFSSSLLLFKGLDLHSQIPLNQAICLSLEPNFPRSLPLWLPPRHLLPSVLHQ